MKSFRVPQYLERYEDVVFDLEQPLGINPNDGAYQKRETMKIVADNTGETTPFDRYNARLSVDFKVDKLADHAALALTDHIGRVNGSNTVIKNLSVTANGRQVYNCDYANHCVNIKNLLEYNPSYAKSVGTNEFYFLDTTRNAFRAGGNGNVLEEVNSTYNKGFAARKLLLGTSDDVNCEIPLNRYSFFEELQDKLLPNMKIDLEIKFDEDKNLIWRQGAADAADQSKIPFDYHTTSTLCTAISIQFRRTKVVHGKLSQTLQVDLLERNSIHIKFVYTKFWPFQNN